MQTGDTVQILQTDGVPHWVYAKVISPTEKGGAFVLVDHAGNREHGVQKVVVAAELRMKADLEAQLTQFNADFSAGKFGSKDQSRVRAERENLQAQVDRLS